jgi:hypothetical protein
MSEPFRASMRYAHHRTGCALLASLTANQHSHTRSASNTDVGAVHRDGITPAFHAQQLRPAIKFCWRFYMAHEKTTRLSVVFFDLHSLACYFASS